MPRLSTRSGEEDEDEDLDLQYQSLIRIRQGGDVRRQSHRHLQDTPGHFKRAKDFNLENGEGTVVSRSSQEGTSAADVILMFTPGDHCKCGRIVDSVL